MPIALSVRNFRCLESVDLIDEGKISVVLGDNESGKSSLSSSVEFALTGSAFGLKGKDVAGLVRHDQTRMRVSVRCGSVDVARTQSSGPVIRDIADQFGLDAASLPLVLNPSFCEGGKALAAFLTLQESDPLDARALFANRNDLAPFLDEAFAVAKDGLPKSIIAAAEGMRAKCQRLTHPVVPVGDLDAATKRITELESWSASVEKAALLDARITALGRLIGYFDAVDNYKPSSNDPLGDRRIPLVNLRGLTLGAPSGISETLRAAGYDVSAKLIDAAFLAAKKDIDAAADILSKNPPTAAKKAPPVLSDSSSELLNSLPGKTRADVLSEISKINSEKGFLLAAVGENFRTQELLSQELRSLRSAIASWDAYDAAKAAFDESFQLVEARWANFDAIAKTIATEIASRRTLAGAAFLAKVTEYAAPILSNRELSLSESNELCLNCVPVDLLSGSTRWRLLISVMAAIAKSSGSPLLILDGMDILSPKNRQTTMEFVMDRLSSDFEHIILTSTFRGDANDEVPFTMAGVTKWILSNGHIRAVVAPNTRMM